MNYIGFISQFDKRVLLKKPVYYVDIAPDQIK